jgi:predicted dehydrogenase
MKRRQFIDFGLRGAAGAAAFKAAGQPSVSANDKVSVAIVGVGRMGSGHVRMFLADPGAHIAALCDINQEKTERAGQEVNRAQGATPRLEADFRRLLDDKSIDALIVATPHHWHIPVTLRALQAGKDVYVEKPASHVFREGRLLIESARKYRRIVQHGTQMRSSDTFARAGEVLASGILGEIRMSKAWNIQKRSHPEPAGDAKTPPGVNYDMWLGPAPARTSFNPNRFDPNWHWYPEYGNGDIGGDGIHDLDLARWGLGVSTHPVKITAQGSRTFLKGERNFPDNMMVAYDYADGKVLIYEDRIWVPYGMHGFDSGNAFYGSEGYMIFSRRGYFQVYLGAKEEKGPGMMKGGRGQPEHIRNFLDCVRTRKQPAAPPEEAHLSCGLVHLGEIGYRTGRILHFDPAKEIFPNDKEATARLTKTYRDPWRLPDPV